MLEFLAERRRGRLFGPYFDSFVVTGTQLGYARFTMRQKVLFLVDFERWLERKNLALVDLDEQVVNKFLEKRRRQVRLWKGHARTISHLLEHLRAIRANVGNQPRAGKRLFHRGWMRRDWFR